MSPAASAEPVLRDHDRDAQRNVGWRKNVMISATDLVGGRPPRARVRTRCQWAARTAEI